MKRAGIRGAIAIAAGLVLIAGLPLTRAGADAGPPVRVAGTVKTEQKSSTLQDYASIAQIAAGFAAVVALPFIAWQVRAARKNAMRDRTANLQAEWGGREFIRNVAKVVAFLDVADARDCIRKLRVWESLAHAELPGLPRTPPDPNAPRPSRNDVMYSLTFFEDLCQRYNLKEIDGLSVGRSIGPNLLYEFCRASWFIHWFRAMQQDDLVFNEWETTLRDLRRTRARWFGRVDQIYARIQSQDATFSIRAICLPPRRALEGQWERAGRLSEALGAPTALGQRNVPKGKQVAPVHSGPPGSGWTVVLLPVSIDDSLEQRQWNTGLAVAIEKRLDALSTADLDRAIKAIEDGQSVRDALGASPQLKNKEEWIRGIGCRP